MNERHVKLTRLERLPRAMVPLAFAWVNALEFAEAVSGWMHRKYWN